jgi:beta-galactosidase/beta-glucuronidase
MNKLFLLTGILALISLSLKAQDYKPVPGKLMTRWGEQITPENVFPEYPRPQFIRKKWMNLNGIWQYAVKKQNMPAPTRFDGEILVPFCIESSLSGIGKALNADERIWYKRKFTIPGNWETQNVILNFEAVDHSAAVWVNGLFVGMHKGGYDRFSFNITSFLNETGEQEILVGVDDPSSFGEQPRGKQQIPQQGIWYTPVSGIWQTVWLEAVSTEAWLQEVKIIPDIDAQTVTIIPLANKPLVDGYEVMLEVFDSEKSIAITNVPPDKTAIIKITNPRLWSPDDPFLYDLKLTLISPSSEKLDKTQSYFGMRKISLGSHHGNPVMLLNNKPLFQYGTLDQGWWPDGLHTPPSDEALEFDIIKTKEMGFNMIRKHIKVEPARWYYHCDKIGILVWQDMPSGMVSIPADGAGRPKRPQIIPKKGVDLNMRSETATQYELEMRRMIEQHFNAPSIIMWVPFNEGWGQYSTCRIANTVKALDPTRLVNAVSGWSLRNCGDIYDIHTYDKEVDVPAISVDRASVIGEFGGIGYPVKGHLWNPEMHNWGYQTYQDQQVYLEAYRAKLFQISEMKKNKGLSAAVYTQITDVEGEVNGLITYDREVFKISVDTLKTMHNVLFEE